MTFTSKESEIVFRLAEELTGSTQEGPYRKDILLTNVERRIGARKKNNLTEYLRLVKDDPEEREMLISALTIHTTSWFREMPHFKLGEAQVLQKKDDLKAKKLKFWIAACSTGEEAYSVALHLYHLKHDLNLIYDFEIDASDIDARSIRKAKEAAYSLAHLDDIPLEYRKWLIISEKTFTLKDEVKAHCRFFVNDLTSSFSLPVQEQYEAVICRNVLIYFSSAVVKDVVKRLSARIADNGSLVLGHSEALHETPPGFQFLGNSFYKKTVSSLQIVKESAQKNHSILIIDDSALIRASLRKIVDKMGHDVSECSTAEEATVLLTKKKFNLITLDLNLPGENGIEWLKRQRKLGLKTPVIIISDSSRSEAEKIFGALDNGAQEYVVKKMLSQNPDYLRELFHEISLEKTQKKAEPTQLRSFTFEKFSPEVIVIGASTGGPDALCKLLGDFPQSCPPVIVVQHISYEFAEAFAERLSRVSGLPLGQIGAEHKLERGHLYLAKGDYHLEFFESAKSGLCLSENNDALINGHRPSVDKLFTSLAKANVQAMSVLLTGMGQDGASGMLELSMRGQTYNLAQDEESSVVFGMPKKAIDNGSVAFIGNIFELRNEILKRSGR